MRHGVNVAAIVGNNGIWGLEKHPMQALFGYDVVAELSARHPLRQGDRGARRPRRARDRARRHRPRPRPRLRDAAASRSSTSSPTPPTPTRGPATSPRPRTEPCHQWAGSERHDAVIVPTVGGVPSEVEGGGAGVEAGAAQGLGLRAHRARRGAPRHPRDDRARSRRGSASGSTTSPTRCTASASSRVELAAADRRAPARPRRRPDRAAGRRRRRRTCARDGRSGRSSTRCAGRRAPRGRSRRPARGR